MTPIIHIADSPEDLADRFAIQLIKWVDSSQEDTFHLALSGGKTPSLLFTLLAGKYRDTISWRKIHFWWGDERMVPAEDGESNYGVVNKLLFLKVGLLPNQIHRIKGEVEINLEVQNYSMEIQSEITRINGWPCFDLIMLGLGDDGHTASIFPNELELLESDRITAVALHPETGQQRITLTGKVLNNAKRVAFLAAGNSKSTIYNAIIHDAQGSLRFPAAHIKPSGELHWFIDKECAAIS